MRFSKSPFRLGILVAALAALPSSRAAADDKVVACASTTDIGSLLREVGGDDVDVTVFAPARGDPHFVDPRPSFIKTLSQADIFAITGLEMEVGWAPVLITSARNSKIFAGGAGLVDCSRAIQPLQLPSGSMDRSAGDVHAFGNPHYFLDPLNGLRVAELLRDALATARPEKRSHFESRFTAFHDRLAASMVGEALAKKYDVRKLATLHERGKLLEFLTKQGEAGILGGWLGKLAPHFGAKVVSDHNMWPYFARRFGLEMVGQMEPKPGIPPTTKHLGELVGQMKALGVTVVLTAPYYDRQYADFLIEQTGAKVVATAHQVGSIEGTDDYISMCEHNVRLIADALSDAHK